MAVDAGGGAAKVLQGLPHLKHQHQHQHQHRHQIPRKSRPRQAAPLRPRPLSSPHTSPAPLWSGCLPLPRSVTIPTTHFPSCTQVVLIFMSLCVCMYLALLLRLCARTRFILVCFMCFQIQPPHVTRATTTVFCPQASPLVTAMQQKEEALPTEVDKTPPEPAVQETASNPHPSALLAWTSTPFLPFEEGHLPFCTGR